MLTKSNLIMGTLLVCAALFFADSVEGWYRLPTVVRSIETGKAIKIINSDGTQVRVTRLTILPEKHNEMWEAPEAEQKEKRR